MLLDVTNIAGSEVRVVWAKDGLYHSSLWHSNETWVVDEVIGSSAIVIRCISNRSLPGTKEVVGDYTGKVATFNFQGQPVGETASNVHWDGCEIRFTNS